MLENCIISNLEQSMAWAVKRLHNNNMEHTAYVYEYVFNMDVVKELKVLKLLEYNRQWLDFITPNRHIGEEEIVYDLVYDRMANNTGDELTANMAAYWNKEKSADEALKAIRFTNKKYDQYCFKTAKALQCLKRIRYAELYKPNGNPKIQQWHNT